MRRWFVSLLLLSGVGVAAALLNNNIAFLPTSRAAFGAEFERAVQVGTDWIVANPDEDNPALLYMIADMADLSGDHRLRQIVDRYLHNPFTGSHTVWRRLVDRTAQVLPPSRRELDSYEGYQRWIVHAVAQVPLSETERADMFAPNRFMWGSRTHQLFALLLYREYGNHAQAVDDLINHLCEKVALEAQWDVRITDLYLQRIAFILAAGRPARASSVWRRRAGSNRRTAVLQTAPLTTWVRRLVCGL